MSMVDVYEKAIVTNSLSKTYSTPAARVGWVVVDEEVSNRIRTYRDYSMICGGGAKSKLWKKIMANVLGAELRSPASEQLYILYKVPAWQDALH